MAAMYSAVNAQTAEKGSKSCDRPLLPYFLAKARLERCSKDTGMMKFTIFKSIDI